MKKEDLVERISEWEHKAGESFADYFMHDNVKTLSWAFWLLGKGFEEHALVLIAELEKGETYFDQDDLFEIYPEHIYDGGEEAKWQPDNYRKNIEVWAEFLVATQSYRERVNNFFNE